MLKVLDLFSGPGGISLGLEWTGGFETEAFCEIEEFPINLLKKNWPGVPIHKDVRTLDGTQYRGAVDVVCGGYPCQPYSVAGKQEGAADDRHLWPSMFKIIKQVRPTWVIGENVYGHIKLGLDKVLLDLENEGYSTRTFVVPACAVGADHRRDRVWIVAYSERNKQSRKEPRLRTARRVGRVKQPVEAYRNWEVALSAFRGMDDALPRSVDRTDCIRNAVVPQIPELIGRAILEHEAAH